MGGAVLTTAAAGAEGATLPALGSKVWSLALVKWVGFGTVAGAVAVGALHQVIPASSGNTSKEVSAAAAVPARDSSRFVEPTPAMPTPPPIEDPTPVPPKETRPSFPASRATRVPVAAATSEPTLGSVVAAPRAVGPSALAAEVALLDQVRDAVSLGRGEAALDLLQRYAREFPQGTLGLEATVLRIEAFFLTGSSDKAVAMGREFLAAHPTSTHASRVRRLLTEQQKP